MSVSRVPCRSSPCERGAGVFGAGSQSQQEREGLQKQLKKPQRNELGKELPTAKAIWEDKRNLWI